MSCRHCQRERGVHLLFRTGILGTRPSDDIRHAESGECLAYSPDDAEIAAEKALVDAAAASLTPTQAQAVTASLTPAQAAAISAASTGPGGTSVRFSHGDVNPISGGISAAVGSMFLRSQAGGGVPELYYKESSAPDGWVLIDSNPGQPIPASATPDEATRPTGADDEPKATPPKPPTARAVLARLLELTQNAIIEATTAHAFPLGSQRLAIHQGAIALGHLEHEIAPVLAELQGLLGKHGHPTACPYCGEGEAFLESETRIAQERGVCHPFERRFSCGHVLAVRAKSILDRPAAVPFRPDQKRPPISDPSDVRTSKVAVEEVDE